LTCFGLIIIIDSEADNTKNSRACEKTNIVPRVSHLPALPGNEVEDRPGRTRWLLTFKMAESRTSYFFAYLWIGWWPRLINTQKMKLGQFRFLKGQLLRGALGTIQTYLYMGLNTNGVVLVGWGALLFRRSSHSKNLNNGKYFPCHLICDELVADYVKHKECFKDWVFTTVPKYKGRDTGVNSAIQIMHRALTKRPEI